MTSMILDIPESTPSLNYVFKGHWSNRHRLRVKWGWLVRAARLEAKLFPTSPLQKAKITVERWGPKTLDRDNLIGGCKAMIDSLKVEGFIVDDSPEHVETTFIQHIGKRHTRVTIEEACSHPRGTNWTRGNDGQTGFCPDCFTQVGRTLQ